MVDLLDSKVKNKKDIIKYPVLHSPSQTFSPDQKGFYIPSRIIFNLTNSNGTHGFVLFKLDFFNVRIRQYNVNVDDGIGLLHLNLYISLLIGMEAQKHWDLCRYLYLPHRAGGHLSVPRCGKNASRAEIDGQGAQSKICQRPRGSNRSTTDQHRQ